MVRIIFAPISEVEVCGECVRLLNVRSVSEADCLMHWAIRLLRADRDDEAKRGWAVDIGGV